jgi:hypothetical protein
MTGTTTELTEKTAFYAEIGRMTAAAAKVEWILYEIVNRLGVKANRSSAKECASAITKAAKDGAVSETSLAHDLEQWSASCHRWLDDRGARVHALVAYRFDGSEWIPASVEPKSNRSLAVDASSVQVTTQGLQSLIGPGFELAKRLPRNTGLELM